MRSTFCGSRVQSKWDKDTVDKASNHSIIAITYHQHIRLSSSDKTLPGLQRRSGQCRGHFFAVEAARQLLKPTSGLGCSRDTVHGQSKHHCGRTNPAAVQTPHLVPAPTVRTEAISSEWVAVQAGRGAWHDGPLYWVCTVYSMLSSVKIPHTCWWNLPQQDYPQQYSSHPNSHQSLASGATRQNLHCRRLPDMRYQASLPQSTRSSNDSLASHLFAAYVDDFIRNQDCEGPDKVQWVQVESR